MASDLVPRQRADDRAGSRPTPTVGLALPVFNGDRYLRETVDAVLAQTFTDFELVIVDNASTDGTAAIGEEFAARDNRIHYFRNDENIGAGPNHNRAYEFTSGRYFKWVAHDDVPAPTFLERCVEALEKDPDAVLAYPHAQIIDEHGHVAEDYSWDFRTDSPSAATRFASMLEEHKCFQIYGLIRRSALEHTDLIGNYAHGDGVLLAQLALLGRFVEIPETLFFSRRHPERSMQMVGDYWSYAVWFDPHHGGKRIFPHWRMFAEYLRAVAKAPIPIRDRTGALRELGRVVAQRWRLLRGDILYHARPKLQALGVPERMLRRRA